MDIFWKLALALALLSVVASAGQSTMEYTVQPGDTLYNIGQSYGISWQVLAEANDIADPTKLPVGTVLAIPDVANDSAGNSFNPRRVEVIPHVTPSERLLLACLIDAEARGESFEGQVGVAAVVVNRVKSHSFPNSIYDVIYQPGQFTPICSGRLPDEPREAAVEAAYAALAGEDPTGGALYFYNPEKTINPDFWETREVLRQIGNHNFAL